VTRLSPPARLLLAGLIDWTGTGFYLAVSAIFLTRAVGLTPPQVGLALAAVGVVAFAGSVPLGRLADRAGQTQTLLALLIVRAVAFAALATIPALPLTLALLAAIALADQAAASVTQALAGELVEPSERVAFMARYRTVINVGITLGTIPAGVVLAGAHAFGFLLAANAASYLAAAALVATLPRHKPKPRTRPRLLIPSAPTTALIGVDGLMSMWVVVLNVGLPLWILQATPAAPALVAILYATNTILAVLFQRRASRLVRTYVDAARAQRAAGLLLATTCACLAASATGSPTAATLLLVLAVLTLTAAELLKASAAWQITFTLAPPARAAEFFATYGLGRMAAQIGGPVLVTAVVLALGSPGWLLLGALFLLGAAATPPLARAARARPEAARRPPRDPYWPAPRSIAGVIRSSAFGSTLTSSFPPSVLIRSVSFRDSLPLIRVVAGNPPTTT
jgi:Major Facilitator Superfamily